jgi:transketolase
MNPEPLADKWRAFGWHVITIDGHNLRQILAALTEAKTVKARPTIIIGKTVKGKGVSFMENQPGWHGVAPTREELQQALAELNNDGREAR